MPAAPPLTRPLFLLLLIGGGTFGVGLFQAATAYSFQRRAARMPGSVVGVQTRMRDNGLREAEERCPQVRFTVGARQIDFVDDDCGAAAPPLAVGAGVTVLYDAADPDHARVQSARVWRRPALLLLVGLLIGLVGGVPLRRIARRAAKQP